MMRLAAAVFLISAATELPAQSTRNPGGRAKALENAIKLGNSGDVVAARGTVDSLIRNIPNDSSDFADLLFARARFATSVLDANLDYERIVSGSATTPRRKESLLRLAQRALIAGDANKSLGYLNTISRDYPDDSSQALSAYWKRRVLLDSHDVGVTVADARPTTVTPATSVPAASITPNSSKLYAVQVSAFARQKDAEEMSQRLRKTGLDAHVDGTTRPFRVRIGHYKSYAEAAKALRDLKPRNLAGFVTELGK
jgi:hypothetical protein